jgi:hypothetical protein
MDGVAAAQPLDQRVHHGEQREGEGAQPDADADQGDGGRPGTTIIGWADTADMRRSRAIGALNRARSARLRGASRLNKALPDRLYHRGIRMAALRQPTGRGGRSSQASSSARSEARVVRVEALKLAGRAAVERRRAAAGPAAGPRGRDRAPAAPSRDPQARTRRLKCNL